MNLLRKTWFIGIVIILAISVFFRFYRFYDFQYWAVDEEILMMYMQKMIHFHTISLIIFNSSLGISVGSYLHLLYTAAFLLLHKNIFLLYSAMSAMGVITSLLIFWLSSKFINGRFSFIAAIIYSSSFLMSLFDRRWFLISIDALFSFIAIFSLFMIITKKKYLYSIPLVIGIGLSFHADPTLAVIPFSTCLVFLVFRVNILTKKFLPALFVFLIFLLPFVVSESRHPGSVSQPILNSFTKKAAHGIAISKPDYDLKYILDTFGRFLFITPSNKIDNLFSYYNSDENAYAPPVAPAVTEILVWIFFLFPLYFLFKDRSKENRVFLKITYTYVAAFFVSVLAFSFLFKMFIWQHFFVIVIPAFYLLVAFTIYKITYRKNLFLLFLLTCYVYLNAIALFGSKFEQATLRQKISLADSVIREVGNNEFSLYAYKGTDLEGMTYIFVLENHIPQKSYIYSFLYWIMSAHSLFLANPNDGIEGNKIVSLYNENNKLKAVILDNFQKTYNNKVYFDEMNKN